MVSTAQLKRRRNPYLGMRDPHPMVRIPEELLSEILSWLPARSVIRFRCVCKLWRSMTHDPCFIDTHLDRACKSGPPSILLFLNWKLEQGMDRYSIAVMDHDSRRTPTRILRGPKPRCGNSCNGLLCIDGYSEDKRISVINPVTGESLSLPKHTKTGDCSGAYLGFHSETKEYKVICFFTLYNHGPRLARTSCEVYTLGTSNWRQICIPDPYFFSWSLSAPAIVMGVVYWLIWVWDGDQWKYSLLSFDLKSETFTRISPPSSQIYEGEVYENHHDLVELQGSVFVTVTLPEVSASRPMDIWMLTINTDDGNNTKYDWALKYSVLLPIGNGCKSTLSTLLIHNEKILVYRRVWTGYDSDRKDEVAELIYCHLNSRSQGPELFYCVGEPVSPRIYDHLKDEHEEEKDFFHNCEMGCFRPFVHINSLVSLRSIQAYSNTGGPSRT